MVKAGGYSGTSESSDTDGSAGWLVDVEVSGDVGVPVQRLKAGATLGCRCNT
ncbi:hypothetical protein NG798_24850 [Ancylothrix sp. C2]|uniref:hypothetical protein n=1 Tax=Ancylothrix sp. D3o TaxID=2953691 RepID=UPI0021BB7DC5|nr:hypothetical protein [Ancylothrix sp. D3o]MCT7953030.1 hypothetical protein [Ancylothrix sp. D3o]